LSEGRVPLVGMSSTGAYVTPFKRGCSPAGVEVGSTLHQQQQQQKLGGGQKLKCVKARFPGDGNMTWFQNPLLRTATDLLGDHDLDLEG
jgi:hypothetical protein